MACHVVITLTGYAQLHPCLALLHRNLGNLVIVVERLLGAIHVQAVEIKRILRLYRAVLADAERKRDLDVATPLRATGALPCRYIGRCCRHPDSRQTDKKGWQELPVYTATSSLLVVPVVCEVSAPASLYI